MSEPLGVAYVKWIDATQQGHWTDETMPRQLAEKTASACQTIGFVMFEDETALVLAQSLDSENLPANCIAIPKIAIQERRVVRVKLG